MIRRTSTFGNETHGGANRPAMFCWVSGHMRCVSPHEQVSPGGLGQREIARLGLWDPNTSLTSAFGLGHFTMAADDQKRMEDLVLGLWVADTGLRLWWS